MQTYPALLTIEFTRTFTVTEPERATLRRGERIDIMAAHREQDDHTFFVGVNWSEFSLPNDSFRIVPVTTRCENHPSRPAVGVTGNEQPFCATCIRSEYDYSRHHVPEALIDGDRPVTFADYLRECAARLQEAEE